MVSAEGIELLGKKQDANRSVLIQFLSVFELRKFSQVIELRGRFSEFGMAKETLQARGISSSLETKLR